MYVVKQELTPKYSLIIRSMVLKAYISLPHMDFKSFNIKSLQEQTSIHGIISPFIIDTISNNGPPSQECEELVTSRKNSLGLHLNSYIS